MSSFSKKWTLAYETDQSIDLFDFNDGPSLGGRGLREDSMSPAVACQGKEFLFVNACGECPRCEEESKKLLEVWGRTPLRRVPDHIRGPINQAQAILAAKKKEVEHGASH